MTLNDLIDRRLLLNVLTEQFSDSELKTLCFELGVDDERLTTGNKEDRARELVLHFARRKVLITLYEMVQDKRPGQLPPLQLPQAPLAPHATQRHPIGTECGPLRIALAPDTSGWQLTVSNRSDAKVTGIKLIIRRPPLVLVQGSYDVGTLRAGVQGRPQLLTSALDLPTSAMLNFTLIYTVEGSSPVRAECSLALS